jgi:hypothetical protein
MSALKRMAVSYFEGLIEGSFKTAADGQRLFYPWGIFGKGYVLPDALTERRIRKVLKVYYMVSLLLVIIVVPTVRFSGFYSGFYYELALITVLLLVYGVGALSLTRRLLTSGERLRLTESLANSGRAHRHAVIWSGFIVSVLFVVGIGMLLDRQVGIGLLVILFFGICGTAVGYMLRTRAQPS